MAGRIKKMAKEVGLNVMTGGLYGAGKSVKTVAGMASCKKKGGKWVKGRCVMGPETKMKGSPGPRPDIMSTRPKPRKGRKKYPGTGDWYPEKG